MKLNVSHHGRHALHHAFRLPGLQTRHLKLEKCRTTKTTRTKHVAKLEAVFRETRTTKIRPPECKCCSQFSVEVINVNCLQIGSAVLNAAQELLTFTKMADTRPPECECCVQFYTKVVVVVHEIAHCRPRRGSRCVEFCAGLRLPRRWRTPGLQSVSTVLILSYFVFFMFVPT